jgi:hypothetical protein
VYSNYICTNNNFLPPLSGKECTGELFKANQINFYIGKKIFQYKKLSLLPKMGFGYVFFENFFIDFSPISPISGGATKWHYASDVNNLREDNFNFNISIPIYININPLIDLKIRTDYQQGFFKIYDNSIIAWSPVDIDVLEIPEDVSTHKYLRSNSYGSNLQLGLGIQFKIK